MKDVWWKIKWKTNNKEWKKMWRRENKRTKKKKEWYMEVNSAQEKVWGYKIKYDLK